MPRSITLERGCPERLGASIAPDGVHFAVISQNAERIDLCLFNENGEREAERLPLPGREGAVRFGFVPDLKPGARYGFRASGPFDPARGHRFDHAKLLVDPAAAALDRPFAFHPALAAPPERALDTAPFVPRGVVIDLARDAAPLPFRAPGLTYELLVRGFSKTHPGVPIETRGTLAALREPALLDHLGRIGVETVELMPLAAWLDEGRLAGLGLTNAWGYNPITHAAPDPRLAPGGFADVRRTVDTLHERGIRVLLDVVLNHSGEGDEFGPTISYRGLDNRLFYATPEDDPGTLLNHTGTGNTFAVHREPVARLLLESLQTWVEAAGIDGFRYDLATVMARDPGGFDADAPFLRSLREDPVLAGRIHVMEPWDLGPHGYQVGAFPAPFFEWQDKFRDDVRRFWRGESGRVGALATRLAGSADLYDRDGRRPSSSFNFVAAHDGFTLLDLTSHERKHNEANGEGNRDGHNDNHSWNNGVEGTTGDPSIRAARGRDVRALLATLFVSRGTPMLLAGDEMGRTQEGNNNGYAQDNETTWLDWAGADEALVAFTGRLARLRREHPALGADAFLTGQAEPGEPLPDVAWLREDASVMTPGDWDDPGRRFLGMSLFAEGERALVYLNAGREDRPVRHPAARAGWRWRLRVRSDVPDAGAQDAEAGLTVAARAVFILVEEPVG